MPAFATTEPVDDEHARGMVRKGNGGDRRQLDVQRASDMRLEAPHHRHTKLTSSA